jgi:hypothetical protein
LANLATKDGLITLAGINSSQADQNANKNEHFRSFNITYPPRKKQKTEEAGSSEKGGIELLGKRPIFQPSSAPKKETYQRLLRLSPAQRSGTPRKRIGAIASGFAKESEIVVFDATSAIPGDKDIISRITLPERQEAADLDITHVDTDEFSLAYCDDHNVYEQTFKYNFDTKQVEKRPNGPRRVHQTLASDSFGNTKGRSKFRCLRFLNAENVVALVNKPNKIGAELRLYHLYPTGPALEMQVKQLPARIKSASSMDVCALDADPNGNQQFAIAVAGQDISIEIYTINYQAATDTFSALRNHMTLRDVHGQQMTKVCWAPFHSPPRAPDPAETATAGKNGEPTTTSASRPQHPGPQYARLASVSYGNTVVIDTFPLTVLEPKDKHSRYVLSHPQDEAFRKWAYIGVISFVVLVTAFLFQSYTSAGYSGADVGPWSYVPAHLRQMLDLSPDGTYRATVTKVVSITRPIGGSISKLKDVLAQHHASPENVAATAVIVRDVPEGEGIEVAVHPDKDAYLSQNPQAKHWDELEPHQQSLWKEKLIQAGRWAEAEGESVLRGVLWSTYAGLVGQAGQVLREL